ncbi:MAG: TetR/AcrR family transcriptional regulator [Deltaproteobacteria bacterium]|nr:TetR/AcrR family transcriptional regulator [Deltaproteobacteria bacterium]MBW1951857.1 TetR/AcrR family transcriptional regulator [Deltaproteobacteria bacterium]MBW1986563.1 TetR/AcrR family transcriptional regulator [Deltaproteobacteria bacterium]MBW2134517.1 TetR/AcrR family transcriptional regulator [Deltaproteobacteria bacterium]
MTETVLPTFLNLPQAKQDKIVAAALAEFADKGYQQASINVMVANTGIAKGSMYQYFKDKKGIFLYIFEFAISLVRCTLMQVKEATREEDFFTRLEKSLLAGVEFIRHHPRIYGIYLKILFDQHVPQRQQLLKAIRQFAAEYFQSLLRQGLERGELRADLPGSAVIFLLDALFDRFLQATCVPFFDVTLGLEQAPAEEIEQRVQELIELLRAGLAG